MHELLSFTIIIEPDRQRLAQFTINTVQALGGDVFDATVVMTNLLHRLRQGCLQSDGQVRTRLILEDTNLWLEWGDQRETVTKIPEPPAGEIVQALCSRLQQASESTDPELLLLRNQRITADLERARKQAAKEVADLERVLDKKKLELQESIHLAETDGLTGLFNRGAFDIRLREAFYRSSRQGEPLCLIALDVDNFKGINDTHGHQYGDDYLKLMADRIRAAIREHVDYPCRMGGDEFTIIVSTDQAISLRIARNILAAMANGVSIGIAERRDGDTIESLMGRADAALYEVKRNGRGYIVVADADPASEDQDAKRAG